MAERGKWAEAEVRKELQKLEDANMRFAFNRIPDAHGGYMQPADADFQWFYDTGRTFGVPHEATADDLSMGRIGTVRKGGMVMTQVPHTRNGVIEVKEVEHLFRLDHKNFSSDKIARVWRRYVAGCEEKVLVAHKLKGMRKPDVTWRQVPLQFFHDTVYVKGVGSWDLSQFPLVDMPAVVAGLIK